MGTRKNHKKSNKRFRKTRSKKQRGGVTEQEKKHNMNASLIMASSKGDTIIVNELLENGADVNAKDNWGHTALIKASYEGHTEIMKTLLKMGAEVNEKDNDGYTALITATEKGHINIVELLSNQDGIDMNAKEDDNGYTALILASFYGHTEIAAMLLKKGADVNVKSNDSSTALMEASRCDTEADLPWYQVEYMMQYKTEIVQMLLEKGADVNARNDDGETAFQIASKNECTETIQLLKQYIVAQTIPKGLERQEDRKNLEMVIREKPVKRKFGKHRLPPEIGHEMMKFLGGKRKTKKSKKSNRKTRKSKK